MSKFHSLRIARVDRETRDAVAVTLDVPPELREQFRYLQGQHLTVRKTVDGHDHRRSYSICSAPSDDRLRIAIKRSPGGVFSMWANQHLRAGDTLDVMPPMGHFHVPLDATAQRHYVAFAAGSGITPILSIAKTTLASEPRAHFTLFYGNRASAAVMFREELAALKDLNLERFTLVHVLSREAQDVELLHGRIDGARASALLDVWAPLAGIDYVFVCGPDGMMQSILDMLHARGYPAAKIKIERFAASIPKHEHRPAVVAEGKSGETEVTVIIDGTTRVFTLDRTTENIIDGGLRQGVELPYSCKGGVCSTCRCKLVEGEVDMDVNFALEDYEVARGFILACQSYPATDSVTVDFDQTGTG
ncbi:MAG TPA: 1,2-phenylacetyl-CoA epoxidase subunit PaaE [Casimicrobiaceae bacterium]|nr:1,2-phenylacetyl-CoA epoxidase subunit PaaE [Casimicrobiaceae bacterium]